MDRSEKLEMLRNLDEKELTERFLVPLFSEGMGFKSIQKTHGVLEFGKDIIYYTEDPFGNRKYTGVQIKATDIRASDTDTIFRQINDAFGGPFTDSDGKPKSLDEFVLITSGEFTANARASLSRSLKSANLLRNVTFIDGSKLVELLDRYLPSAFWDQYDHFNRYFHAMKEEFETIADMTAIGQKEPVPLEEIYVSLRLSKEGEIPRER